MATKTAESSGKAQSLPINVSNARHTSNNERIEAAGVIRRAAESLQQIKAVFGDRWDLNVMENPDARKKLEGIINLDVNAKIKEWLMEGDTRVITQPDDGKNTIYENTNFGNKDYETGDKLSRDAKWLTKYEKNQDGLTPSLYEVFKNFKSDKPQDLQNDLFILMKWCKKEADWLLDNKPKQTKSDDVHPNPFKAISRIAHEQEQYDSKASHSGSPSAITRGFYKAGQKLGANDLNEQMKRITDALLDIEQLHKAVVDLEANVVQLRIADVALDKASSNPIDFINDVVQKGETEVRKYGIQFRDVKQAKNSASDKTSHIGKSSLNGWRADMLVWWSAAQTRLAATEEEKTTITAALAGLTSTKTADAAISEYKMLNEFWITHTGAMTAEQQRSNLVSRNSLISDMDGVNMMWRESVTIYFASPTSPVNSGTLADADKTTVKFLNDCYSDFNYTRGTDEDWLKVEQLSRRLTAANMKDGSSAQQRNDMPPPQSKQ